MNKMADAREPVVREREGLSIQTREPGFGRGRAQEPGGQQEGSEDEDVDGRQEQRQQTTRTTVTDDKNNGDG